MTKALATAVEAMQQSDARMEMRHNGPPALRARAFLLSHTKEFLGASCA